MNLDEIVIPEAIPKTIEELKKWYRDSGLPGEEITGFYIGKDYKFPKVFGIYLDLDSLNYIVYKNKSDGTRAIRYEGQDEEYAVKEFFTRLVQEIENQKNNQYNDDQSNNDESPKSRNHFNVKVCSILIIILLAVFGIFFEIQSQKNTGYSDTYYDYYDDDYDYDDYDYDDDSSSSWDSSSTDWDSDW